MIKSRDQIREFIRQQNLISQESPAGLISLDDLLSHLDANFLQGPQDRDLLVVSLEELKTVFAKVVKPLPQDAAES